MPPSTCICGSAEEVQGAIGFSTSQIKGLGADIGIRCETCDRHVLVERAALERRIEGFVSRGDPVISAAVGPNRP